MATRLLTRPLRCILAAIVLALTLLIPVGQPLTTVSAAQARPLGATFTVTNTNDSDAGLLRQAILCANATAGADVINITAMGK